MPILTQLDGITSVITPLLTPLENAPVVLDTGIPALELTHDTSRMQHPFDDMMLRHISNMLCHALTICTTWTIDAETDLIALLHAQADRHAHTHAHATATLLYETAHLLQQHTPATWSVQGYKPLLVALLQR